MDKPTCEELFEEEGFDEVHREADDSWRHGSYVWQVFFRHRDQTYWGASYCLSSDGETNELREGAAEINQVWPKETKTITYTRDPQPAPR